MSIWVPLHVHSHDSLLDGLSKPQQIVDRCKELGYEACALTDHGVIGGAPGFLKKCKDGGILGIAGCEFYVCEKDAKDKTPENSELTHLCVLAKNERGWKQLMKASSASFRPEHSYRKQRLSLEQLASYSQGEFIAFSGHPGSRLANICFEDFRAAYDCRSYDDVRPLVRKDFRERVMAEIARFQKLFGKSNFFLEIQLVDQKNMPAALVVARILRDCAKRAGVPTLATGDSHYCRKEDAGDHRVLLCSALDKTLPDIMQRLERGDKVELSSFFRSNNYHIPSPEEMLELHEGYPEELENAVKISQQCESYIVGGKPLLPQYECPNGLTPNQYLTQLCREGWKRIIPKAMQDSGRPEQEYVAEIKKELKVLTEAGLSSYFLIVRDYINYATDVLKCRVGLGRGSAAGCLVSYLLGITRVDPVRYDLMFERFYSSGRNVPAHVNFNEVPFQNFEQEGEVDAEFVAANGLPERLKQLRGNRWFEQEGELLGVSRVYGYYRHIWESVEVDRSNPKNSHILWVLGKVDSLDPSSPAQITSARIALPDIDSDFPVAFRDQVIEYCREKYGHERVCQMATFSRMQGRGAIKDVLRAHQRCSFEEMNLITEHIPDEAEIADQLQTMREETGEASIIRWALENNPEPLSQWCVIREDGEFDGPLAFDFAQAIRLEGTKRNMGRHASGLIISSAPLADIAPMVYDKSTGEMIVGVDMKDAEEMGLVKFDILGLRTLDCIQGAESLIRTGCI